MGLGVGLFLGEGDGVGLVCTPLTRGVLVTGTLGTATAFGFALAKYSATGTTIMPTITVNTKVTAPHSRRIKVLLTSREFYPDSRPAIGPTFRAPGLVVVLVHACDAFFFLLLALV